MVRHARNKKRRAGRVVKFKNKNRKPYKRPQIESDKIRPLWDARKTPRQNMHTLGLTPQPNATIKSKGLPIIPCAAGGILGQLDDNDDVEQSSRKPAVQLFEVPDSDMLSADAKGKLPISERDQKYMVKCFQKYCLDYVSMARDIKLNDMQHTEHKLRKLGSRFLLLTPEQLRVDVPAAVQKLMGD